MVLFYVLIFILLVIFSGFFSSAETSLLALNKIKLNLKVKKKHKKAVLLSGILRKPEEFFSTILIGNNFVNIAAASISTFLFTRLMAGREELILLTSTLVTTIIILFFAEILPKSYAFRYNERLSYLYAYPIKFFTYLFYPLVKVTTFFSNLFFKEEHAAAKDKEFTTEEVKDFLASHINLFKYHPEGLRMVNEIIDIAEKDIKSIMTPRLNIVAFKEDSSFEELKQIILEKKRSKIPMYKDSLDNITGIIHAGDILSALLAGDFNRADVKKIARPPIFISEYSSVNYVLKKFKKLRLNIAVIVDEYGSTIGILTLNDVFKEIMGEIEFGEPSIGKIGKNTYVIKGNTPVEDVNERLHLDFPEKPDYTTMSGFFIYHFGKFPKENSRIQVRDNYLVVRRMGKRKIAEILLTTAHEEK
jgi:putative hemolysin